MIVSLLFLLSPFLGQIKLQIYVKLVVLSLEFVTLLLYSNRIAQFLGGASATPRLREFRWNPIKTYPRIIVCSAIPGIRDHSKRHLDRSQHPRVRPVASSKRTASLGQTDDVCLPLHFAAYASHLDWQTWWTRLCASYRLPNSTRRSAWTRGRREAEITNRLVWISCGQSVND